MEKPDSLKVEEIYHLIYKRFTEFFLLAVIIVILSLTLVIPTSGWSLLLGMVVLISLTIFSKKKTKQKIMDGFDLTENQTNEIIKSYHKLSANQRKKLFNKPTGNPE